MNTDVLLSDKTYSLVLMKLEHFKSSFALIVPFHFHSDEREILRAYTKFQMIKKETKVFSVEEDKFLDGSGRNAVIEILINRVITGMGWNPNTCSKNLIRRYRLVSVLNCPHLHLHRDIDIHHVQGLSSIISGDIINSALDDRTKNLVLMSRKEHNSLHINFGDNGFIEM
jgi:hypothetical protein